MHCRRPGTGQACIAGAAGGSTFGRRWAAARAGRQGHACACRPTCSCEARANCRAASKLFMRGSCRGWGGWGGAVHERGQEHERRQGGDAAGQGACTNQARDRRAAGAAPRAWKALVPPHVRKSTGKRGCLSDSSVAQSGSKVEKMTRRPAPSSSTTCRHSTAAVQWKSARWSGLPASASPSGTSPLQVGQQPLPPSLPLSQPPSSLPAPRLEHRVHKVVAGPPLRAHGRHLHGGGVLELCRWVWGLGWG